MNKRIYSIATIIFIICISVFAFAGSPFGSEPMEEALDSMEGDSYYEVNSNYVWQWAASFFTFEPVIEVPTQGIIIYPGANIDVRSYAVLAEKLVKDGYFVALVPMPLDLALFGYNRANKVIDEFGNIETWAIAGHSLGGTMACNYAKNHQDSVDAVILLASYPSNLYRLDGTSLKALSIYGANDGLTTLDEIEDSADHLPADTEFYEIEGGNHSQFGYYTPETSGDNEADISRSSQTDHIYSAILSFIPEL